MSIKGPPEAIRNRASGQPGRDVRTPKGSVRMSDAPQEPATPARVGGALALEVDPEPAIPLAVPDVGEGLDEGVTENQRAIIPGHPGRDAAGKHVAVGSHVAQGPRPLA